MNTITIGKVLLTLCDYHHIDRNYNGTIDYHQFKAAMFGSGIIASSITVSNKWNQIANNKALTIHKGQKPNGTHFIALDMYGVERAIVRDGLELPSNWAGNDDIYIENTNTQTDTEGAQ